MPKTISIKSTAGGWFSSLMERMGDDWNVSITDHRCYPAEHDGLAYPPIAAYPGDSEPSTNWGGYIGQQYSTYGISPIYNRHYSPGWTRGVVQFPLADVQRYSNVINAVLTFTVGDGYLSQAIDIGVYKCLKKIHGTNMYVKNTGYVAWDEYGMGAGVDYDPTLIATFTITPSNVWYGKKFEIDITYFMQSVVGTDASYVGFMLEPINFSARRSTAIANAEFVKFCSGDNGTVSYPMGEFHIVTPVYPYLSGVGTGGGAVENQPSIELMYNPSIVYFKADPDGSHPVSSYATISTDDEYAMMGYFLVGEAMVPQKYYVRNNANTIVRDLRLFCDWARVTRQTYTGTGEVTLAPVLVRNGIPGIDSPIDQRWKLTCITGGINGNFDVQVDSGTNGVNWYAADPVRLSLSDEVGSYTSSAALGYVNVSLTGAHPQPADTITFSTISNLNVPGATADSETLIIISPDVSGGYSTWYNLMPAHTVVSTRANAGVTGVYVNSTDRFEVGDLIVMMAATDFTVYQQSVISEIGISGNYMGVTGELTSSLEVGDEVYVEPMTLGDFSPFQMGDYYKAFWLMVNAPEGTSMGMRAVRIQAWEGLLNRG